MKPHLSLLLFTSICHQTVIAQTAAPASSNGTVVQDPMRELLDHFTQAAREHDFRLAASPDQRLEVTSEPVQVYSHPAGLAGTIGAFYVWTIDNQPAVVGSIWSYERADGLRGIHHEFHLLATEPVLVTKIGAGKWQPQAGIERHRVPGAATPASRQELRLAQMRSLAARFQGFSHSDDVEVRLRILPQPLYRGLPANGDVMDCALFGLYADWDPEILLLIEAKRDTNGELAWFYSAGRFNICAMRMEFDEKEIWSQPAAPQTVLTFGDPNGPYFAVHDVEVLQSSR